jgi:hypothetical protein
MVKFNTIAIMIGQRPPHGHTTPAPGANRVRKNGNLHIAHNILLLVYKKEQATEEIVFGNITDVDPVI